MPKEGHTEETLDYTTEPNIRSWKTLTESTSPHFKKLATLERYPPLCGIDEFWVKMRKKETISWSTTVQEGKDRKVKLLSQIKWPDRKVLTSLPSENTISANPDSPPRNTFPTNPRYTNTSISWVIGTAQSTT